MLFVLAGLLIALGVAAYVAHRERRLTTAQFRLALALFVVLALLLAVAVAIDRIEAA